MEFITGDYISKVWILEVNDSVLTIVSVLREKSKMWEITITWDKPSMPTQRIDCVTPINKLILPANFEEEHITAHVEGVVRSFEAFPSCSRVAVIDICSDDPQVFIDKFLEVAQQNERLSCSFISRDLPPLKGIT